jgi:predicted DNA-binding ribbon-helix-helix protein
MELTNLLDVGKVWLPSAQQQVRGVTMDVQYAFRIPSDLLDQLRAIAKDQDMTIAQLFRKLGRDCVEDYEKTVKSLDTVSCS